MSKVILLLALVLCLSSTTVSARWASSESERFADLLVQAPAAAGGGD
jgi:hypothetical protein